MADDWKHDLIERFREKLPEDRRHDRCFKVFYSDVFEAPLALIGLNPGGNPADEDAHKQSVYSPEQHSYKSSYPLAKKMREWLEAPPLSLPVERIPKLNVIFERSKRVADLEDAGASTRRSSDFVTEILDRIRPRAVIFEGVKAFEYFRTYQETSVLRKEEYLNKRLRILELKWRDKDLTAFVLAHPTGSRWPAAAWTKATGIVSERLHALLAARK